MKRAHQADMLRLTRTKREVDSSLKFSQGRRPATLALLIHSRRSHLQLFAEYATQDFQANPKAQVAPCVRQGIIVLPVEGAFFALETLHAKLTLVKTCLPRRWDSGSMLRPLQISKTRFQRFIIVFAPRAQEAALLFRHAGTQLLSQPATQTVCSVPRVRQVRCAAHAGQGSPTLLHRMGVSVAAILGQQVGCTSVQLR